MIYGIKLRTWQRLHHYAHIWCDSVDIEDDQVQYVLTGDRARELNEIDESGWLGSYGFKEGDLSYRFDYRDEALAAGIKVIRERYKHDGVIQVGDSIYEGRQLTKEIENDLRERFPCKRVLTISADEHYAQITPVTKLKEPGR